MTAPTLTDFLLARIAEDEEVARAATVPENVPGADAGRWYELDEEVIALDDSHRSLYGCARDECEECGNFGAFGSARRADVAHIARHDPARVLAECEAKRGAIEAAWVDHVRIEGEWGSCQSREQMDAKGDVPDVVAALALPYADHPGFRPEFREGWQP